MVRNRWWHALLFVVLLALGYQLLDRVERTSFSYSDFREALTTGKVQAVTVSEDRISGTMAPESAGGEPRPFVVVRVEDRT
ncbi:ATP-dependent metallopeptidase FtsH/Yme1/Tma family protein [Archangium violaceum]|uniref:ATP-dependent metallopeptidase FtsH/Yme1/Tma family protein n=1 Tax=Archangium violaceum TaxID=83451 RepID=UPI00193B4FA7|nr:ATP-dependent metallopeptidase FtsH/Yme1/Tma family protein [Archangium violaceum]QRK08369.1 ATP-dependent metallopeptidase FtsH/Yme1/Tma family protein [Archangium violaceum]